MISISGNSINDWNDFGIKDNRYPLFVISSGFQKFITRNLKISRPAGRVDYQIITLSKARVTMILATEQRKCLKEYHRVPARPEQLYEYFAKDETELY